MKKILINKKGLIKQDTWLNFRKVRAIVKNENEEYLLTKEGGVYIFPGGKCEKDELEEDAIIRELYEETGIKLSNEVMEKVLEIEAFYDDFYDFRSNSLKPRHMITTYFYIKTNKNIIKNNLRLTKSEQENGFEVFSLDKNNLCKLLQEEHNDILNGKFFYEENKIVMDEILLSDNH